MAFLDEEFNANDVDPTDSFRVYPAGKYLVEIVASEMMQTKSGDGTMLKLEMEVLDGPEKGHKIFARLNLVNPNQTAVEIARRQLSQICHAIGVERVRDSEELHFKPLVVDLKVRPAGNDKNGIYRDAQNEIRAFCNPDGSAATRGSAWQLQQQPQQRQQAAQSQGRPSPQAASGGGSTPPWHR